ncbi:hypothetical protein BDR26DRAFT_870051 [Obelidium mucronatum]|nr:hypothetical protein BDR26DRAFT_870051 [Obelidium mucronatum]
MSSVDNLKAFIAKKDWSAAEAVADKLLVQKDVGAPIYIQACYAHAMILAKISEHLDNLVDPDRAKCDFVELEPQDFRNAISFLLEGFKLAVSSNLKDFIFMGASCFLRLTQELYLNGQLRFLFVIPLSIVEQGITNYQDERSEILIRIRRMLADVLTDYLDPKKQNTKVLDLTPWPTIEDTASDRVVSILESLAPFVRSRPQDYNLPFNIIKTYIKLLKYAPSAKSAIIDQLLQKDSLLKTYYNIHGGSTTDIADPKTLFATIDEKIKSKDTSKQVLSFLLDLAEHSLMSGKFALCKQALEKSSLIPENSNLNIRRELVQLQLDLKENHQKFGTKNEKKIESSLSKLNHAICSAAEGGIEPFVIQTSCTTVWSVISTIEDSPALFAIWLKSTRHCLTSTHRCNFEHRLARCYEFQNIFSLATTHADKALKFCTQPDLSNDIEILLHKLWIKANTFDGHLTPDLKVSDHDLISPPNVTEKDDIVLSLLKNDYAINFDIINANDIKNQRTILVALSDVMRQSRELAQRQLKSGLIQRFKFWKAVWDSSMYLMTLEIDKLVDTISAQKLKAEALLYQGEALFTFETIKPYANSISPSEKHAENLKAIHQAVIEPMIQSLNIGISLKDSLTIQSAASHIWDYFATTKSGLSTSNLSFWTDTFQRLYDGLIECQLQNTNLMVCVCIGYLTASTEKSPAKGGKGAPLPEVKNDKKNAKQAQQTNSNTKLLEDLVNLGLSASCGSYETKLELFDLKTAMKFDHTMKIFSCLEILESRKASKDELEEAARNMYLNGSKLGKIMNFELWLRIIQHAYKAEHFHLAYLTIQTLFDTYSGTYTPSNIMASKEINPSLILTGKLLYGQIILSLIERNHLFGTPTVMRASATQKLANGMDIICSLQPVQTSHLQNSLDLLCQVVSNGEPHKSYLAHLERVLGNLYTSFFAKVSVQNLISTDFKMQTAILKLTEFCLKIYKGKSDWAASTRLIDKMFRLLPKSFHKTLLQAKVQTLSLGNKSGINTLLKDWDLQTQLEMWFMLTTFASDPEKQNNAFQECLNCTREDLTLSNKRVEIELLYARWLLNTTGNLEDAKPYIENTYSIYKSRQQPISGLLFLSKHFPGSVKEKTVQESSKSRATTPSAEKHSEFSVKTLESWVGFEWSQQAKDYFINSSSMTYILQFLSCLFYILTEFEKLGQLQQCVPVLCVMSLVMSCFDPNESALMVSSIHLYNAVIHSKLFYVERSYYALEHTLNPIASSWNDDGNGHDIGHRLDRHSIIMLKAVLLIQYGEISKANNILTQWIPHIEHNREALYLRNSYEFRPDIVTIENLQQATVFIKITSEIVKSGSMAIFENCAESILTLLNTAVKFCESNEWLQMLLQYSKYHIYTTLMPSCESEIRDSFLSSVALMKVMDYCKLEAETKLHYAKFIRSKASEKKKRELAKCLLLSLNYMEDCKDQCESMLIVDKSQSWIIFQFKVVLEEADLLYQITQLGDLIDSNNRTIDVMIEEHFTPSGEVSLSTRWLGIQSDAVEKIITNLSKYIESFPPALQTQGRQLLGLCHKIKYKSLMGVNNEDASNHLKISQLHFSRALKFALPSGDIDVLYVNDTTSDEFTRFTHLAILQSCDGWKYMMETFHQLSPAWKSEHVLGSPLQLSPENLIEIPKNMKVLVLHHSLDRSRIFGGVLMRTKDTKSKNPLEDFFIATMNIEVNESTLNEISRRSQEIQNSALEGAIPDIQLINDIYSYFEPILKLLELEMPNGKSTDKSDSSKKKGNVKAPVGEVEEIDRGHCVICCDQFLDMFPLEVVLRVKNLATTSSRDFGVSYLLQRIQFGPGYLAEPAAAAPTKKEKSGGGGGNNSALWEISSIRVLSVYDTGTDFFGPLPSGLKLESKTVRMNSNELCTGMESCQAAMLLDEKFTLDPIVVTKVPNPPNVLVSLTKTAEDAQEMRFLLMGRKLAACSYLNGISLTMALDRPSPSCQTQAFVHNFIKAKDAIKYKSDAPSGDIQNRRLLFGAHFVRTYGFL